MGGFLTGIALILDTPCSAGARSDGLRPCSQDVSHRCHNVRKRQFEENLPRGAVPGRIWRNIVFVHILQKKLQTAAEKGSLNRPIPLLIFINCDPLSDHSKSKAQTTKVQQPRPCLLIPFAKLNYSCHGAGEEHQNLMCSTDGKSASRNKN